MADVELVIKIPEEEYNIIKKCNIPMPWAENLIANGTPLPKGHGRLIDADVLKKDMIRYGWHHVDSTVHEYIDDFSYVIPAEDEE